MQIMEGSEKRRAGNLIAELFLHQRSRQVLSGESITQVDLRVRFEAARWILLFQDGSPDPLAARFDDADNRCRLPVPAVQVSQQRAAVCLP